MSNQADPKNYYKILEVSPDADMSVLKSQYFKLAKFWHPDHNESPKAIEKFQEISVAYDILKDEKTKLFYDLLSLVYSENNFPDIAALTPFLNFEKKLDLMIRCLSIRKITGMIVKTKEESVPLIMTFKEAKQSLFKTAIHNWLFGWWGINSAGKNWRALSENMDVFSTNKKNNLKLFIHNMIALIQENKAKQACLLAKLAKNYTSNQRENDLLESFIVLTGEDSPRELPEWDYNKLKQVQMLIPAILGFILLTAVCGTIFSRSYFTHTKQEINYNQTVRGISGDTVDDVIVSRVINIPSDSSDITMLYHLKSDAKIMYGPDDNFDVLAESEKGHTVRVTGYTPDNTWYRVMIDNGQNGFVRGRFLSKGIGNEIPSSSKIYKSEE